MKLKVIVENNSDNVADKVSKMIRDLILEKEKENKPCVLCLPTGSSPIPTYKKLVKMHKEEGLSFKNVITFNLDEYYPMTPDNIRSYRYFMDQHLFNHIDIEPQNIHIPSGIVEFNKVKQHCKNYEFEIAKVGGFDLALLGIGRTGHIGFNEPGSKKEDLTRMVFLDEKTRRDAAYDFGGKKFVPDKALTQGIGTIYKAKKILLIATGDGKSHIIKKTIEGKIDNYSECPAAYLRDHNDCTFIIDKDAAQELVSEKKPWLGNPYYEWDFNSIKKAVVLTSLKMKKPICSLTLQDFYHNELTDLMVKFKRDVDAVTTKVFDDILSKFVKITPTNNQIETDKLLPNFDDNILLFSPHPDDDSICCGGILQRLRENKSKTAKLNIAYMTSGSVAVYDQTLLNNLRFLKFSFQQFFPKNDNKNKEDKQNENKLDSKIFETYSKAIKYISSKKKGIYVNEPQYIQELKGNVRKAEAVSSVSCLGLSEENTDFLDLPFYSGLIKKNNVSSKDFEIVKNHIKKNQPKHIFTAADLNDPHGTHAICYSIVKQSLLELIEEEDKKKLGKNKYRDIKIWLYKGSWHEHKVYNANILFPLSKRALMLKIDAIFKHQSQKDKAMFPGDDSREFWQRARDRNIKTANELALLGFPHYYACESFCTCKPEEMP